MPLKGQTQETLAPFKGKVMTKLAKASIEQLIQLMDEEPTRIAQIIDHTLLKPDATEDMIEQLCQEAIRYQS